MINQHNNKPSRRNERLKTPPQISLEKPPSSSINGTPMPGSYKPPKHQTMEVKLLLRKNSLEWSLLGIRWNKDANTLAVSFSQESPATTERGILSKVPKIYDPLGVASPTTPLKRKFLYRDSWQLKKAWDAELPQELGNTMEEMGNKYSRESGVTNVFGLGKTTHKVHFAPRFWRCQFLRGSCSCVCSGGTRIRNETRISGS